jgi:hypothetical protein
MSKPMQTSYFLCMVMLFFFCGALYADELMNYQAVRGRSLTPYLLSQEDSLYQQLADLFHDPHMFDSQSHLKRAGFKVKSGNSRTKLMVAGHSSIPNHLLKKFPNSVSQSKQLDNFIRRIKGARTLRNAIQKHNFKHLVVPEKWLYKLPKQFPSHSYVLVVEKMDIYDDGNDPNGETRKRYYNIDKEVLTELCILLHEVGGCDSLPRNIPFTRSGQIAFIDTEHVGTTKTREQFHRDTIPLLNPELQAYAIALWEQLEEESKRK